MFSMVLWSNVERERERERERVSELENSRVRDAELTLERETHICVGNWKMKKKA
ncbi:unnamed protein product [Camellia sinensis]